MSGPARRKGGTLTETYEIELAGTSSSTIGASEERWSSKSARAQVDDSAEGGIA